MSDLPKCELPESCRTKPGTLGATLDAMRHGEHYAKRFANPAGNGPPRTTAEWDVSLVCNDAAGKIWQWLKAQPGFAELETLLLARFGKVAAADAQTLAAQAAEKAGKTFDDLRAMPLLKAVALLGNKRSDNHQAGPFIAEAIRLRDAILVAAGTDLYDPLPEEPSPADCGALCPERLQSVDLTALDSLRPDGDDALKDLADQVIEAMHNLHDEAVRQLDRERTLLPNALALAALDRPITEMTRQAKDASHDAETTEAASKFVDLILQKMAEMAANQSKAGAPPAPPLDPSKTDGEYTAAHFAADVKALEQAKAAGEVPNTSCGPRDWLWQRWDAARLGPAAIRDRWNGLTDEERRGIAPDAALPIGGETKGRHTVKSALRRAAK